MMMYRPVYSHACNEESIALEILHVCLGAVALMDIKSGRNTVLLKTVTMKRLVHMHIVLESLYSHFIMML